VLWERSVVEQRYDAVREVLEGRGVTEVAGRYGVSRQSVYTWVGRYRAGGLAGLQDRSHRPNHSPDKTTAEVEAAVCELRRTHPGWGAAAAWLGAGTQTGGAAAVAGDDLADPGPQPADRRFPASPSPPRLSALEREAPMSLWQMDIMGGVWLATGTEAKLVTGIDDHSRDCVVAHLVLQATGRAVCQALVDGLAAWGLPGEVLTDTGSSSPAVSPSRAGSRCCSNSSCGTTGSATA
jgi:hypothetical protein